MRRWRWPLVSVLVIAPVTGALLRRVDSSPIVATVAIGSKPQRTITVDPEGGRAFVSNEGSSALRMLDTRTGRLLRTVRIGGGILWTAVDPGTERLFASSYPEGVVYMLDARTGAVLHSTKEAGDNTAELAVDPQAGRVFVGHWHRTKISVFDAHSGTLLRHLEACPNPPHLAVSVRTQHVFVSCQWALAMLDERTGRLLRLVPHRNRGLETVLVDDRTDRVFTFLGSTMEVFDARTGAPLRTVPNLPIVGSAVVDERSGCLYAALAGPWATGNAATASAVVVLDGRTGATLHSIPVAANPTAVAVDARTGHVFVSSVGPVDAKGTPVGNGTLSVLDGANGRVLRTVAVGIAPSDVRIDAPARRVLVLNRNVDQYADPVATRPAEEWWPKALRGLKGAVGWLPFTAPKPPTPTTDGSVTTLDLARL